MIPTITGDEKRYWDRQMRSYARRSRNRILWQLIKSLAAPILLVICAAIAIGTWESPRQPKSVFNADSNYVDSLLQDHSRIPANVLIDSANTQTQKAYDSTLKAEYGERRDSE